jgi:hypothetical protein
MKECNLQAFIKECNLQAFIEECNLQETCQNVYSTGILYSIIISL